MAKPWKFEIGGRVWIYDDNRRVYRKRTDGKRTGDLIYALSYVPCTVVGKDGLSYLIRRDGYSRAEKVSRGKAELLYKMDAEKELDVWLRAHRPQLGHLLAGCADVDKLRMIALILRHDWDAYEQE